MQLDEDQKHVIKELLKFNKQVQTLGGPAGSGKTIVVKHLKEILSNFAVCAFTGKAAQVLRSKGIEDASTIHSLIYVPEKDEYGNILLDSNGSPNFILASSINYEGFLVDEASMINKELNMDLRSFGKPIIFTGDHYQLEPIGETVNLMAAPDFVLEKIHRNAGEIAFFAEHIRKGFRPQSWQNISSGGKVKFISKRDIDKHLNVDQILCSFNKTRVEINEMSRSTKGYNKKLEVGDKIMILRNNRLKAVFNGMQGIIKYLYPNKNRLIFETDSESHDIFYDPSQIGKEKYEIDFDRNNPEPIDYADCITTHKAQGSEWETGLVIEQKCDKWDNRRHGYTSASRFKEKVWWAS